MDGQRSTNQLTMNLAILGTGMVGIALATKLVQGGHHVVMGSRTANNESATKWAASLGNRARAATFADAAAFGEMVLDCTNGANSLSALHDAGAGNLRGKILIQVGNPLDFSKGMPPTMTVCNTDSLGEQAQREFPDTRVVKALNTINCEVMIAPSRIPGDHQLFICGNDAGAKEKVAQHLSDWFGWKRANVIDLGDITAARGTEMYLPLWLRLWSVVGSPIFNIQVMRGS
jgi:predicted dinucleotide-binding enzyme